MNKHTPGPWVVGEPNKGPVAGTVPVHTADYMESYRAGQLVCSVYGTAAFSDANARLIAAAPDMLAALRCALADLQGIMPEHEPSGERQHPAWLTIDELYATIVKATGGHE